MMVWFVRFLVCWFLVFWMWGSSLCFAQNSSNCALPDLMLVVDTSGSMSQAQKLTAAQTAISNVLKKFKSNLRFGLIHFSNGKAHLDVQLGPADTKDIDSHIQSILSVVSSLKAEGDTPMKAAMQLVYDNYQKKIIPEDPAHKDPNPNSKRTHYVLLLTDGEPTDGDPTPLIASLRTLQVGTKQYDIKTYVVGLGGNLDIRPFQLNQFAQVGGTTRFYQVFQPKDLEPTLKNITQALSDQKEECNNLDDNCNGQIDENLKRECKSECGIGIQLCQKGSWSSCNAPKSEAEVCDGHDNDCDGQVDEDLTRICSTECGIGSQSCIHGDWSICTAPRPTPEICDGLDNDCNGQIDEVPKACPGGQCIKQDGKIFCMLSCRGGECPSGFLCDATSNECKELPCQRKKCAPGEICINKGAQIAECVDLCKDVTCPAGQTCGRQGTCINCYQQDCPPQKVCKEGRCVEDRCANVQCAPHQACSDGVCLDVCAGKKCAAGSRCQTIDPHYPKGVCFPDACAGIQCPHQQTCLRGQCIPDRCASSTGSKCQKGQLCEPETGLCKDNPCIWTRCPSNTKCELGECISGESTPPTSCPGVKEGQCCSDKDCASNFACKSGYCVQPSTTTPPGYGSAGCACHAHNTQKLPWQPLFWMSLLFGFLLLLRHTHPTTKGTR